MVRRMAASPPAPRVAAPIIAELRAEYGDAECALNFRSPLELLIATILSAQCTDQRVNLVTKSLFKKYRSAAAFAQADRGELEQDIQSTGFFRNKAKNIQACCRDLVDLHDGQVPPRIEDLVRLAGVGRKTANVVLGTAFGIASGVVVDTHVGRIVRRLGLTAQTDPEKVERELMAILPSEEWVNFSHRLIHHGRKVCIARKPRCEDCVLKELCPRIGVESSPAPKSRSTKAVRRKTAAVRKRATR